MSRIGYLGIAGFFAFCLLIACGDKINPAGDIPKHDAAPVGGALGGIDGGQAVEVGPVPSYADVNMPLHKRSCTCHTDGAQTPLLDTFTNVTSNARAALAAISDGSMPGVPALSGDEQKIFEAWVSAGTPNN